MNVAVSFHLVLEVGAENSVADQELAESQGPRPPNLPLLGQVLDLLLEVLELLELTLPATACREGVLTAPPLLLLLSGGIRSKGLLSELVLLLVGHAGI